MSNGAGFSQLDIWHRRTLNGLGARGLAAGVQPSFNLREIPDDTPGGKIEALWEFPALFHVVDGGVG